MEKRAVVLLSLVLVSIFASALVYAVDAPTTAAPSATQALTDFFGGTKAVFTDLAEKILGEGPAQTGTSAAGRTPGDYLFARVLFLLIVLSVVWLVMDRIPMFSSSPWIVAIISISASILATRFLLQPEWIESALLPYTALGIALTAFLPLFIYFYFVESSVSSKTMRKISWVLAAVVFAGLWWARANESKLGNAIWIYPATAIACIILLVADGTIHHWWQKVKAEKNLKTADYIKYTHESEKREKVQKAYLKAIEEGNEAQKTALKAELDRIDAAIDTLIK